MVLRQMLFVVATFMATASFRLLENIRIIHNQNIMLRERLNVESKKLNESSIVKDGHNKQFNQSEPSSTPVVDERPVGVDNKGPTRVNQEPIMVLHVGPRKTGTSAIQKFAQAHEDELEQANFYYLGHYGKHYETNFHFLSDYCLQCQSGGDCDCRKRWDDFNNTVTQHFMQGHNVMISDETFNRFFLEGKEDMLWERLLPVLRGWQLRIVFTYRHYHSWIPSSYHQSYHPRGSHNRKARENWPGEGGWVIPSFPDYVSRFSQQNAKQPDWVLSKWKNKFPGKVQVFNMHHNDMLSSFFCAMVPEVEAMCKRLTKEGSNFSMNSKANKDVLHYDMLVVAAYQKGFIKKSLSRKDVSAEAEKYALEIGLKSISDFPLECLSEVQSEKLLNIALHTQSIMLGSSKGAKDLRSDFAENSKKGAFCSIDTNATLQDARWRRFFKHLD